MPEPIRALTIWQPWATLIAIGAKPFETRSWATHYRGRLAIHASIDRRGLALCRGEAAIEHALSVAGFTLCQGCRRGLCSGADSVPLGCIVAVAELDQCWPTEAIIADGLADPFGDYSAGRFAWRLHRPEALDEPVPCKGRQGLWTPCPEVRRRIEEARRG
jgi:hypothetical protein